MVWYIVIVAIVNLGVGFALAVVCGRGPRPDERRQIVLALPGGWWIRRSTEALDDPDIDQPAHRVKTTPEAPATGATVPAGNVETTQKVSCTPAPPHEDETLPDDSTSECDTSVVGASIDDVMLGLKNFRQQLRDLDSKVRTCSKQPDPRKVETCVEEFRQANDDCLAANHEAAAKLQQQRSPDNQADDVSAAVEQAIAAQCDDLESANRKLDELDVEGDPEGSCRQLLKGAGELNQSSGTLAGLLVETQRDVAREQGWNETLNDEQRSDELTMLATRLEMESALEEFWRKDPQRDRDLTLAMIELDQCAQIGSTHGLAVVDELVKAVSRVVAASIKLEDQLAARYQEQTFAIMIPDHLPKEATQMIERIRQILQQTTFEHDGAAVELTASCAIVLAQRDDTTASLCERLEQTVQEAKAQGSNRTLINEGESPVLAAPAKLEIESTTYQV